MNSAQRVSSGTAANLEHAMKLLELRESFQEHSYDQCSDAANGFGDGWDRLVALPGRVQFETNEASAMQVLSDEWD